MAGVVIDRLSHAVLAHHLAGTGSGIGELPAILEATVIATFGETLRHSGGSVRIATERAKRATSFRNGVFAHADGSACHLPRLAALLRRDEDGDIVFAMREIEIAPGVRARHAGVRHPFTLLLADGLPDTMARGLAGVQVREVVSHPTMDAIDMSIVRTEGLDRDQVLDLILPTDAAAMTSLELTPFGKTVVNDR